LGPNVKPVNVPSTDLLPVESFRRCPKEPRLRPTFERLAGAKRRPGRVEALRKAEGEGAGGSVRLGPARRALLGDVGDEQASVLCSRVHDVVGLVVLRERISGILVVQAAVFVVPIDAPRGD